MAFSLCDLVNKGIRSPPATAMSWDSGTPAARMTLIASPLPMIVAPVFFANLSAPGRLKEFHWSVNPSF